MKLNEIICIDKNILSGIPVFKETRVPIKNFFDYLETGESIETFLKDFPSVKKEQVLKLLEILEETILSKELSK
ncbi:hypothetical protein BMS3Abin03_02723 [bacterium BMS3Abin03]|nr:hypothetical protein BMS3Abin03_02723 [bacterium BMS3Abin03]